MLSEVTELVEQAVEEELRNRRKGSVVRLEVGAGVSDALLAALVESVKASTQDVYRVDGPLDLRALFPLVELPSLEDLRDAPLKPLATLDADQRRRLGTSWTSVEARI